jgi:hypothetical protein
MDLELRIGGGSRQYALKAWRAFDSRRTIVAWTAEYVIRVLGPCRHRIKPMRLLSGH